MSLLQPVCKMVLFGHPSWPYLKPSWDLWFQNNTEWQDDFVSRQNTKVLGLSGRAKRLCVETCLGCSEERNGWTTKCTCNSMAHFKSHSDIGFWFYSLTFDNACCISKLNTAVTITQSQKVSQRLKCHFGFLPQPVGFKKFTQRAT